MVTPQTFIFIGKSGSGKGTQAVLLGDYLKSVDSRKVFNIETGTEFRKFINQPNYSASLAKEIQVLGERQPDFLAINMWGRSLIENLESDEHIMGDGFPRSAIEAVVLDTAFKFYKRDKPFIVYLDITHDSATDRLIKRGRADDHGEAIKNRLKFFEDDVRPAVEYYKANPSYHFLDIDGEPSIEEIHKNIIAEVEKRWR